MLKKIKSYLYRMGKGKKDSKKAPPKTMEELTKNFEEFMKSKEANENAKEDFEEGLKKIVKKKDN